MIQYLEWAKVQLKRQPSIYDWQQMNIAEMAERALAICKETRSSQRPLTYADAFYHLEKMAQMMLDKYPPRG